MYDALPSVATTAGAARQEVLVGAVDQLLGTLAVAQLAEPDADRSHGRADAQLGAQALKAPPRFICIDAQEDAEKLIAAEAHEQVVGAHVAPEAGDDVPQ